MCRFKALKINYKMPSTQLQWFSGSNRQAVCKQERQGNRDTGNGKTIDRVNDCWAIVNNNSAVTECG